MTLCPKRDEAGTYVAKIPWFRPRGLQYSPWGGGLPKSSQQRGSETEQGSAGTELRRDDDRREKIKEWFTALSLRRLSRVVSVRLLTLLSTTAPRISRQNFSPTLLSMQFVATSLNSVFHTLSDDLNNFFTRILAHRIYLN